MTWPGAWDSCRCGHNRAAHLQRGAGECTRMVLRARSIDNDPADTVLTRCGCPAFTERSTH